MSLRMILRILGLLLMMFSLTMVPPIAIAAAIPPLVRWSSSSNRKSSPSIRAASPSICRPSAFI